MCRPQLLSHSAQSLNHRDLETQRGSVLVLTWARQLTSRGGKALAWWPGKGRKGGAGLAASTWFIWNRVSDRLSQTSLRCARASPQRPGEATLGRVTTWLSSTAGGGRGETSQPLNHLLVCEFISPLIFLGDNNDVSPFKKFTYLLERERERKRLCACTHAREWGERQRARGDLKLTPRRA